MSEAEVKHKLLTGLYSFNDLSTSDKIVLAQVLRPNPTFTEAQRLEMEGWFLELTLPLPTPPPGLEFPKYSYDGKYYTPIHLLTDIRPGELWNSVAGYLTGLRIVYIEPSIIFAE